MAHNQSKNQGGVQHFLLSLCQHDCQLVLPCMYNGPYSELLKLWQYSCRRFVCLYDVEDRVLLRRVTISANRSLDGVLDQLNSRGMTDAGPPALLDDVPSDEDELLPPTTAGVLHLLFSVMQRFVE